MSNASQKEISTIGIWKRMLTSLLTHNVVLPLLDYEEAEQESNMDSVDQHNIDKWFGYVSSTPEQNQARKEIRLAAKQLAELLVVHCPKGGDRGAALRKLREVVMTARDAITLGE